MDHADHENASQNAKVAKDHFEPVEAKRNSFKALFLRERELGRRMRKDYKEGQKDIGHSMSKFN